MARSTSITVKILADASQASRELEKSAGGVSKFQRGIQKAAVPAAAIGTGLVLFAKAAGKAASDAEQAAGAVDAVFGKTAKTIHQFARGAAEGVGLASSEYEQMATVFGSQLHNMGMSANQLAPTTNKLIKLGADLAAQYGGTTADAVSALSALLRGETDPIERYGVSIKQADIAAEKAKHGLSGLTGAAAKQASMTATLALLTKQTASAHGAFAREADTAAHAQQVANAKWVDAQAALGKALLPVMTVFANMLGKVSGLLGDNATATTVVLGTIGALAAGVLALNAAYKVQTAAVAVAGKGTKIYAAAQKIAAAATWLLNAAMSANPAVLITVAVLALVAAVVLLYKKSATFRAIVTAAFDAVKRAASACYEWIRRNWPLLLAVLAGPIGVAVAVIVRHWSAIKAAAKAVFDWLGKAASSVFGALGRAASRFLEPIIRIFDAMKAAIQTVIDAVEWLIDKIAHIHLPKLPSWLPGVKGAPPAPAVAGPAIAGRSTAGAGGAVRATGPGGPGVVINISGALDPEAVARQIRAILGRHDVRVGHSARTGVVAV